MRQHYPLDPVTGIENASLSWFNGNPATGQNGSFPPFGLFVDPQSEILALQRSAGLADSLDGSDTTQASQALSRGPWLGAIGQPATVNDLVSALPGSIIWPSLLIGMKFGGFISAANTGPMTVTLTGFGTLPGKLNLVGRNGGALQAGDVPANVPFEFRFDGTKFRLSGGAASDTIAVITANQIGIQNEVAFTTAGTFTYTPSSGTRAVEVEVQGAGGGGGGSSNCGASQVSAGISGGSGAYARKYLTSGFSGVTVVVGAAGAGGPANTGSGGSGGTSSFGSLVSCTGGIGGAATSAVSSAGSGNSSTAGGGTATGGDVNVAGQYSGASLYLQGAVLAGKAGESQFGRSGIQYGVTTPGAVGTGYGSGGTAGVTLANGNGQPGAPGTGGCVIIREFK